MNTNILSLLAILLFSSTIVAKDKVSFSFEVRPILSDKCFSCHGPDPENREGKLRLDTPDGAYKALKKGMHPVKPGSLEKSLVWERITTDDEDDLMPPPDSNLSLTKKEKETIKQWIEQGAEYQSHWAFESIPAKIAVPKVKGPQKNEIDAFIQAKLAAAKLHSSPETSKELLYRRAKMVLTGLPPTSEETEKFIQDKSPDAYENAVDRFLKDPSCAEKLAVDWMDLSRFADTYGFQVDRPREMTAWRDWVLKALNNNMPYDQFITWQLAGDLIPNPTQDSILATAFNRHHQQKVEGGTVEEEFRVEYVADRTHTAGTAFMGLTFECCRCHDHKYDPISMKDYYRLFAYFNSIDESGLYSYFTKSVPTPALPLISENKEKELNALKAKITTTKSILSKLKDSEKAPFEAWLKKSSPLDISGKVGEFSFDDHKKGLTNQVKGKPNAKGSHTLIDSPTGKAFLLNGDRSINFNKLNKLNRAAPLSLNLAIKIPERMTRSVIIHQSKAWTDAASRGYEILVEDGKLSWAFIHFWPGNAIRIKTKHDVPVKKWINLTATYDGSSQAAGLKLYLDGKPLECEIVRDNLTKEINYGGATSIQIGARMRDKGFKNGSLDNFMFFERELTPFEVKAISSSSALKKDNSTACYNYYLNNHSKAYKGALNALKTARGKYNSVFNKISEIMVMKELSIPRETFVLKRGLYSAPDPKQRVYPTPPEEIMVADKNLPKNRLGLSQWLTNPKNPLTSRVAVNRYWMMIFGHGIVTTPDDFGSQGALPSHPQLLNWLSKRFIESGWNTKALLKLMVMSHTFRQQSSTNENQLKTDPDNKYLSYGPRQRLSAEMIRDQVLSASNSLKRSFGGRSENAKKSTRRSLYLHWKRNDPPPAMLIFDAPRRQICTVKREITSTPLQALVLLNKEMYIKSAKSIADISLVKYSGDRTKALRHIFTTLTGRSPRKTEEKILFALLDDQIKHFKDNPKEAKQFLSKNSPGFKWKNREEIAAWSIIASAIMNLDASITLR